MTHHLPSHELIDKKYKNKSINYAFANSLDHLMDPEFIICWISGHTYTSITTKLRGVLNIINPFGYPNETEYGYDRKKCLVVD